VRRDGKQHVEQVSLASVDALHLRGRSWGQGLRGRGMGESGDKKLGVSELGAGTESSTLSSCRLYSWVRFTCMCCKYMCICGDQVSSATNTMTEKGTLEDFFGSNLSYSPHLHSSSHHTHIAPAAPAPTPFATAFLHF
jgi:hypothetical protein